MDKVLQRAKRATRSAQKRAANKKLAEEAAERWRINQARQRMLKANSDHHSMARATWRANWVYGPLAPRPDVGELADRYGTSTVYNIQAPDRMPKSRAWMPIEKGDRVVCTHGPSRGQIGYVSEVSEEKQAVTVLEVNQEEVYVPDWVLREARNQDSNAKSVQTFNRPLPIQHVKLVYPLPDPVTGIPKDVVIDKLEKVELEEEEGYEAGAGTREEYRAIAGSDVIIPWPELPGTQEEEVFDNDTPRITVDEITVRSYLLRPPMPTSVIDELRNKYSKFRTRHTPEFEAKVEAIAAREERRKELGKTMRTPLQELAEMRARQKAAETRVLSDEQMAKIGEVMAQGERSPAQAAAAQ